MIRLLRKWFPSIFCRPTDKTMRCIKCGKQSFELVSDGGYTAYVKCKCCGAAQPDTYILVI